MPDFRFPQTDHRKLIMGRTGSGKSQYGAWVLGNAPFDRMPYIIIDYKVDKLLNGTPLIKEIGLDELPKQPGLYIMHPREDQNDEVEAWLWKVWKQGRTGLFIDEGYMLPDEKALNALLTQGRSKEIPIIALTQRPKWLNRFLISEADFYTVFKLNDVKDEARVKEFTPRGLLDVKIEKYWSRWYDVGEDVAMLIKPVPSSDEILDQIEKRLRIRKRVV